MKVIKAVVPIAGQITRSYKHEIFHSTRAQSFSPIDHRSEMKERLEVSKIWKVRDHHWGKKQTPDALLQGAVILEETHTPI